MENSLSTIADRIATQVGQAIKQRREALGLSLRKLATGSGISSSMISDIERGAKSPTISTLAALAEALGVPISALIESPASRVKLIRESDCPVIVDPATGAKRVSFGPSVAGSKIEFLSYRVPPHAIAGPFASHPTGTIEHIHLASGTIRIEFGDEIVVLERGDSCSGYADVRHRFDNSTGKSEALIYLIVERA